MLEIVLVFGAIAAGCGACLGIVLAGVGVPTTTVVVITAAGTVLSFLLLCLAKAADDE